jgi:hypothetical protein
MSDYIPPEGWRVKGDDEVVQQGDAFSHSTQGNSWPVPNPISWPMVSSVRNARTEYMTGGYILTPIVSTPQLDVSQEPQTEDMGGWEIYEPVKGDVYSPGTQVKLPEEDSDCWGKPYTKRHGDDVVHPRNVYRRPKQQQARKPLDVHLPEIERKINIAAKDNPEILDWWRGEKERLAIEAGKRMGGGI